MDSPVPPASPEPPQPPSDQKPVAPATLPSSVTVPASRKIPLWLLALLGLLIGVIIFLVGPWFQEKIDDRKQAALDAQPHKEIQAKIQNLLQHGTALPLCPLVYPLLDSHGQVTPLGSYLSYFSMNQASYLPKTVFLIPNAGDIYNEFDLFTRDSPKQKAYRDQLPYYFGNVKDFCEGKLLKAGSGNNIQLRFWGTKPEKKYSKIFGKGDLHLAISWMAACVEDYEGFQPNADQAAYRDKPIFTNDQDLERGAQLETFFRNGGSGLISGWDKILAKNTDNPYLYDRWLSILDSQGGANHLALIQQLVQKNPDNTFSKLDYMVQCEQTGQYDQGVSMGFQELARDDNNPDWYDLTVDCLTDKGFYMEAIQLLKAWTKLHPDNQEAWIKLKDIDVKWAWVARGDGWADSVTPEGWRLMKERMKDAVTAGEQAASLAFGDCRVWSKMLSLGNGAEFDKPRMQGYFNKMFQLNPYRTQGYETYLEYLKPKWSGSVDEMTAFAEKYDAYDPGLLAEAMVELFNVSTEDNSEAAWKKCFQTIKDNMQNPKVLERFEKSDFGYLELHPENLQFWKNMMGWEKTADRQDVVLNYAKKLSRKNPELRALPDLVFLGYAESLKYDWMTDQEKNALDWRPDIVQGSEKAYRDLAQMDPDNWDNWNNLAFYCYQRHDLKKTRQALKTIRNHWSGAIWSKETFDQAVSLCEKPANSYWTGKFH